MAPVLDRTSATMKLLLSLWGQKMASAKLLRGSARASAAQHSPDDQGVWEVKKTLGSKKGRAATNISGIACTGDGFPRACMVIDDEMHSAQFVSVREGELKAGDIIRLTREKLDGDPLELDGEGVAYADGSFYVIGSHGHPRDKGHKLDADEIAARIAAKGVRIRLKPGSGEELREKDGLDVETSSKLRPIIAAQPVLAPFLGERLENNGLTIEGVGGPGRYPLRRLSRARRSMRACRRCFRSGSILSFGESPASKLKRLPLGKGCGV